MGSTGSKEKDTQATGFSTSATDGALEASSVLSGVDVTSRLELIFQARNLRNKDYFSKSDPFLVCSVKGSNGNYSEILRTEIIANNLNPNWVNSAYLNYNFNEIQELSLVVYDVEGSFKSNDSSKLKLGNQNLVGTLTVQVAQLINAKTWSGSLVSKSGKFAGTIKVLCDEVKNTNMNLRLAITVKGVPKKGLSIPPCFVRISKSRTKKPSPFDKNNSDKTSGEWIPTYKTEAVTKKNPEYKVLEGPILQLCNDGDLTRPLLLTLWHWLPTGQHRYIGEIETSIEGLQNLFISKEGIAFSDGHPVGGRLAKIGKLGTLYVSQFQLIKRHTFLDYVRGGCQLNFMVGIDFTLSNKKPNDPNSLHYIDSRPSAPLNPYATAVKGISRVLDYYDSSKTYACYGFGGKLPGGVANHCFPLNGDLKNPYVSGVNGVLSAYYSALNNYDLSGPTILSQLIQQTIAIAKQRPCTQAYQHYTVLLIITDGVVNDMDKTIDAICDASILPLSILILGVGDEDFDEMEILAGRSIDKKLPTTRNGRVPKRDIITFVNMSDLSKYSGYGDLHQIAVAKALLERLPDQVIEYFNAMMIQPNEPLPPPPYEEPSDDEINKNNIETMNIIPQTPISLPTPGESIEIDGN